VGEWSSGTKWADDAPKEVIDANQVSLMSSGAAGAFVHGLEDEFMGKSPTPLHAKTSKSK
jgi:integrator complex subunit 4